jgi:hypothetical protein
VARPACDAGALVGREKHLVSGTEALVPFAVKTYRYLRLAIVVVVVALMVSVLIERAHASCWQDSISAYYYTPVHAMFVGALVAIGVSLIAIRGSTDLEDVLLNVAGVLAPIVAFVPTGVPTDSCASAGIVVADSKPFVDNNVLAFAIGGAIAIGAAFLIARLMGKPTVERSDRPSFLGLLIGVGFLIVGLVWYLGFRKSFLHHAHSWAAIAMFFVIWLAIVLNARSAPGETYRWIYKGTALAMAVSAIVVGIIKLVHHDWQHQVLWIEVLELLPFAVYWAAQTFEHWDGGVPTGAERQARAAASSFATTAPPPDGGA